MSGGQFAAGTEVPVERSKGELDGVLTRYGASQRLVFSDDEQCLAVVQFKMKGRLVRLSLPLIPAAQFEERWGRERPRNKSALDYDARAKWCAEKAEQATREVWRRLLLVVKAKLELVASGGSTVEQEFLANIVLSDGSTVYQRIAAPIAEEYASGVSSGLLLGPKS